MGMFDDLDPQKSRGGSGMFADIVAPKTTMDHVGDVTKGVISGFADLGDTILNATQSLSGGIVPNDVRKEFRKDLRKELRLKDAPAEPDVDRNAARSAELRAFNEENKDATGFNVGRIGGNIAATWPVGGLLGNVVKGLSTAPAVQALGTSIGSGGFRTGVDLTGVPWLSKAAMANMGTRVAGGGAAGAAATGLVSPEDAGTGAVIGGLLPPALKFVGGANALAGKGIHALRTPKDAKTAKVILDAAEANTPEAIAAIRAGLTQQGPSLLPPDAGLTVAQIMQMPGVSQLQRTVKAAGDTSLLGREAMQNEARLRSLGGISPVTGTVQQSAENLGNQLERVILPAEKAERERVRGLYEAVDPFGETGFLPPIAQMLAAKNKFLGPGTFGSGKATDEAISTAKNISKYLDTSTLPKDAVPTSGQFANPVTFQELQNLRSSIGEAAQAAQMNGRNKEFAALSKMIGDIDAGVDAVASGKGSIGEYFPPDIVKAWRGANAAHEAAQLRFKTGPQVSMFRSGADGQRSAQGAELAGKFFNSTRSQADDAKAFKRLIDGNSALQDALKNYGITDLSKQTNRLGTLSNSKFNDWLSGRSGAVRETFDDQERAIMRKIGEDLNASDIGESLGMSKGSNTVQNAQNALGLGLLDSPLASWLANKIPVLNSVTGPVLTSLRDTAKKTKAQDIGGLLSDPEVLDAAIARYLQAQQPGRLGSGFSALEDAADPLMQLLYRGAPLLSTSR